MEIKKPKNENYAATVVEIKTLIPLEKCDNVQGAIIMGNQVVVSKEVKIGDIGLFFPVETALSKEYLKVNNLYRVHKDKPNLNSDTTVKGGYFEENGRIRCAKFLGHKSEGLFMPIESLYFIYDREGIYPKIGDCFDELNGTPICSKYVVKTNRTAGQPGSKKTRDTKKYESKLIENQFRFHQDTSMLYRNLHRIEPNSLISCTYKLHGTSGISSYVLCKKKLNWVENLLSKWFKIENSEYDYLYSSRKVIKNEELNPNAQHFYNEDIWGIAHNEVKDFLQKGMTFYYEIVGFLPNGGAIQKGYDYGCEPTKHAVYIYRITSTNVDGKVIEFSAKQVQDFCKKNGLNAVPQLYYGLALDFAPYGPSDGINWSDGFLERVKHEYNEKDCYMCSNKTPEEGCVVRIEGNDLQVFKCKSNRFYELETKQLDKGEVNIESQDE
jgi:hypothetical protein